MSEKVSITKSKLDSLANAIASVGETSVPKTIAQMESAVLELTIPPNLQSKTITPSITQQIVSPDSGYDAFSQVTVNAIELQEKTITPTTEQQIVIPDNSLAGRISVGTTSTFYNGNTSISVFTIENQNYIANATYSFQGKLVGSNGGVINLRGSKTGSTGSLILEEYTNYTYNNINIVGIAWWAELTTTTREKFLIELGSGYNNITWTVAEEVIITNDAYETYDGLSKVTVNAMPSGTAGMPVASKGTVSNHSVSITPSVINTTGYITGGAKMGTAVTVNVAELESGTKSITENGTGISVSGYSTVDVAVQAGTIIDDGDGNINLSPTGEVAVITPLAVNQNGTYTAPSNTGYSPVTVNVGSSFAEEKDVNFIDYDGTVLYSYTATEAQALTELPVNPSHTRLTAQGWNWTLTQIKNQLTNVGGKVWVGQMYTTKSGATEIDIELDNSDYLSPYLTIAVNGTVSVDWGDGTTTSTVTGTSVTSLTYTLHEYAAIGNYTIKISVVSGGFSFYNTTSGKSSILSVYGVDSNRSYNKTYAETVKRIFFGNGASIGSYAFTNCCHLQSVTIPSNVTSIGGAYAFYNCYSLQNITIPSNVTNIGTYTFSGCHSLQSIMIPSSVTSISGNMFFNCCSLQNITIPNGVTSIDANAFSNCYSLQNITIPSSVTSIGIYGFSECHSLQSIIIPNGVRSIGSYMFYRCYSLRNITIPSSVTSIGSYAFNGCQSLQSIIIPNGVTSIMTYTFYTCYSLHSITIPSSVTSIESSVFYNCYGVEEYHITPTAPPTLSNTNAFYNIVPGTIIYVPTASLDSYKTASNWSTYASYMQGE